MHFVALLQAPQNRDRVFDAWFIHHYRLKPAFERRVFLDILAIFIESGCADRAQLAAR